MKKMLFATAIVALVALVGCSSVTIRDKGEQKLASNPMIEQNYDFFLWGLVGEHHVDVNKFCNNAPKQIQVVDTPLNSALAIITLGIYRPRTVRVWCKEE